MTMNSSEFGNLPDGWAETRLPEIALINPKLTAVLDDELDVSFLPMKAVEAISGRADLSEERRIREVRKGYTCFCNGDVLWAKITPCMENGKAAVVRNLKNGVGFGSTEFHVLRPLARRVLAEWLFFFLIQQSVRRDARKNMTGSAGQLRVPTTYLADLALPLPSLVEQCAIVTKIEALFSELDKGVEQLQTIKQQLKQYRQAVLKAAFEGKLTAAWRAERQAAGTLSSADELLEQIRKEREKRYRQQLDEWRRAVDEWEASGGRESGRARPNRPSKRRLPPELSEDELADLQGLPREWMWVRLGMVVCDFKRGPFGSAIKKAFFVPTGFKVYEQGNAIHRSTDRGTYFIGKSKYDELAAFQVKEGDYIVSCSGTIGRIYRLPTGAPPGVINQALLRVRLPDKLVEHAYFAYLFESQQFQRRIMDDTKGTAMINLAGVRELELVEYPLCPLSEQRQVVEEIESRFSILDELDKAVHQAVERAEALRQSILKKAFEGRLLNEPELVAVRSDPEYEPVNKLLERIRAEKGLGEQSSGSRRFRRESRPTGLTRPRGNAAEARSEVE